MAPKRAFWWTAVLTKSWGHKQGLVRSGQERMWLGEREPGASGHVVPGTGTQGRHRDPGPGERDEGREEERVWLLVPSGALRLARLQDQRPEVWEGAAGSPG